ncbi:hypothetical protein TNCV_3684001 [Trichonephila clavipes]|nr:hypothetical protein TNCV_3684001 [Trichonephila clavipes]
MQRLSGDKLLASGFIPIAPEENDIEKLRLVKGWTLYGQTLQAASERIPILTRGQVTRMIPAVSHSFYTSTPYKCKDFDFRPIFYISTPRHIVSLEELGLKPVIRLKHHHELPTVNIQLKFITESFRCKKELIALNKECPKYNERMGLYVRKSAVLGGFERRCRLNPRRIHFWLPNFER